MIFTFYILFNSITLITIDNPPANAANVATRKGLFQSINNFNNDTNAKAAILIYAGRYWTPAPLLEQLANAGKNFAK